MAARRAEYIPKTAGRNKNGVAKATEIRFINDRNVISKTIHPLCQSL
jgi:hypothetical protein